MELVLFNRLEDSNLSSVVGPDGTEVGGSVTYPPGKYGNGIYSASAGQGCTFSSFNGGKSFTLDFWTKMTKNSRPEPIIGSNTGNAAEMPGVSVLWAGHIGTHTWQVSVYPYDIARSITKRFDYAFSSGDNVHINITVDQNGSGAGKLQVRMNGTLITVFAINSDTTSGSDWTNMNDFHICDVAYDNRIPSWYGELVDNFKVFKGLETNTNLRFSERGGMKDQVKVL